MKLVHVGGLHLALPFGLGVFDLSWSTVQLTRFLDPSAVDGLVAAELLGGKPTAIRLEVELTNS